jgi:ATP-binding cassette, subfamily B, bacterial HlyB/CyaB
MRSGGFLCLYMLAAFHGISVNPDQIRHELNLDLDDLSNTDLLQVAQRIGFHARFRKPSLARLSHVGLPAVAFRKDGQAFVLAGLRGEGPDLRYIVHHPSERLPQELSQAEFSSIWSGQLLLVTSRASVVGDLAKFDFSWFIPAVVRYRRLLLEVLGVSLVLQLFALATPIFFQVIMDKVLLHHAITTLNVIATCLLVITLFEVVLTILRGYVFAHTSSRIDVELGARLFRHLLSLPLPYFQARRVGDTVARVRELEHIREFLTGQGLTLVLDIVFSVVFIAVMFFYSVNLTWIVLASIPLYFFLSFFVTPILRRQLDEKFRRGADNQSFLVESITAVDTVKSMSLEPRWIKRWDEQLANYVKAGLRTATTGLLANGGVSLIGKLVTIAITWMGASYVIDAKMTIGELVAFNMLASHVANPIMRLAQMWTDFQQVGISVQRLGDILNVRPEISDGRTSLPKVVGEIRFEDVVFQYRPDSQPVLKRVSFVALPGQSIGIVGRSGSGKSTLTRLVQRMYQPQQGRVLIDGFDLGMADPTSLRRQIGVVLQENVLFNQTIRANIAVARPEASMTAVMAAAQLSGAHEFIRELPEGYDTQVGEHGVGLSGGQRQRLAIARALLSDPRILIFDEATSALDYESERIIQDNMDRIRQGRTVLIVAHRLSAVRHADIILVMERGEIVERGTHEELLAQSGIYSHLYRLQSQ